MTKPRGITLTLFGAAMLCYAASWTAVASGLAFFGVLFELGMWISLFSKRRRPEAADRPSTRATQSDARDA